MICVALFPQPQGGWAKWWAVEVRFDRPLSRRESRVLERRLGSGVFGADGAVWDKWWNSYPHDDDSRELLDAIRRVGVPGRVRTAPYGRDCPGGWACYQAYDERHRCKRGSALACDPVFRDCDWIGVDARRVRP